MTPTMIPILALLLGGTFVYIGVRELRTVTWLRRNGIRVPGTVTGRRSGGNTGSTTAAVFEFDTADGRHVRTSQRVSTNFGMLRAGQAVTVAYDPDKPERAEIIEAKTTTAGAVVALLVGSIFSLAGIVAGVIVFWVL
ncbi:DUF3592 domain-containing protein [Nocardiopsis sediminis]|uniref:DUF3592 domain-containing protein n=1 Tax=Nocardiopsis sediminis TaxID=1778267 RepID=A0ABV8FI05_9ACTN